MSVLLIMRLSNQNRKANDSERVQYGFEWVYDTT